MAHMWPRHQGAAQSDPATKHHAIPVSVVEEWRERWDVLGIL